MKGSSLSLIFLGVLFLVPATLGRYVLRLDLISNRCRRLLASIAPVDLRHKNIDVIIFLLQITALLWIISGVGYGIITAIFTLTKQVDYILSFIAGFGPGLFLAGFGRWLQRKYWSQNDKTD